MDTANPIDSSAVTLYDVIAWVETKTDCRALRFEPAIYSRVAASRSDSEKQTIARIESANRCSWGTALALFSCSFGGTQLMGFNLYGDAQQYRKSALDFLMNEADQRDAFVKFVMIAGIATTPDVLAALPQFRLQFATRYNGPGAPQVYSDTIANSLRHFGFNVIN